MSKTAIFDVYKGEFGTPLYSFNYVPREFKHVVAMLDAASDERGEAYIPGYGKKVQYSTTMVYKYLLPE